MYKTERQGAGKHMDNYMRKVSFVDATIKIVAQAGLENLRTKQIAAESGMSEATMYTHFGSKEEILNTTFLILDRRLSDLLTKNKLVQAVLDGTYSLHNVAYEIWAKVYRYLITHWEETIFVIRYRYSSYHTDEIRHMRRAYSGDFDGVYRIIGDYFSNPNLACCEFSVNYAFEMTFSFAEKIISGRIEDTPELQQRIWLGIKESIKQLMER